MTTLTTQFPFIFERIQCYCLRICIRHIKERGNTAISCSSTFTLYISLLSQSGLTKVHMFVNNSGQNKTPRGIYFFIVSSTGSHFSLYYSCNKIVLYNNRPLESSAFIYNYTTIKQCRHLLAGLAKSLGVGAGAIEVAP